MNRSTRLRFEELFSAQRWLERAALHLMNRADSTARKSEVSALAAAADKLATLWRELETERKALNASINK